MRFAFAWLLVIVLVNPLAGYADSVQDLVEQKEKGVVNWSKGFVEARGVGAVPEKLYGQSSARPGALREATLDAYRNILEVIGAIRIDNSTLVKDYAVENDLIMSKVEGMVQGSEVVKKEYLSDGTVEITLRMNLRNGFSQLILPKEIKPLDSIKPVIPVMPEKSVYSGLVVDARGLQVRPSMSPKILDENGQEVYGSAFVSREFAVQKGMCDYAKDLSAALTNPRVTDNPLTVKGLRTDGDGRTNIAISNADAAKLRSASDHLSFLKKCRVVIVVD